MRRASTLLRFLLPTLLLAALPPGFVFATEAASSGFGEIAIPSPVKPANAENCVEPVEIMRRNHMKFLNHQRDATVIDGERGGKYSLTACIDCHNPASSEKIVRYEDPQHFCADCHRYASVKIDCFECHADRGLNATRQSRRGFETGTGKLSMQTFERQLRATRVD